MAWFWLSENCGFLLWAKPNLFVVEDTFRYPKSSTGLGSLGLWIAVLKRASGSNFSSEPVLKFVAVLCWMSLRKEVCRLESLSFLWYTSSVLSPVVSRDLLSFLLFLYLKLILEAYLSSFSTEFNWFTPRPLKSFFNFSLSVSNSCLIRTYW